MLLKCRCLKWAHIAHLDVWNTSYSQKKGRESNWQFDSQPLKVRNQPDFLAWKQRATYHWKVLDQGYNFALNLITIRGLHKKLCALKVAGVPIDGISGLPLGSPRTKSHLDVAPVEKRRVYYKGEGGGFPQVRAVVSLVCPNCLWILCVQIVLTPEVLQQCTNHLVLVLCRSVWVNKACHFFLIPSRSSSTPLNPFIVLRIRERASIPYLFIHVWVLQGVGGASTMLHAHHDRIIKQKSFTCPKPKPWSQEVTINTLVFKDVDKKFNPKSPTTIDRNDKKLVRFRPTCGLGYKGACNNDHNHLNNIQMLNGSILDMHVQA